MTSSFTSPFEELPARLKELAYASQGELAWPRTEAIRVIDFVASRGWGVCGVEVWLPTVPGPTLPEPFYYQVTVEPATGESWSAFVERSRTETKRFVEEFAWDARDTQSGQWEPYFNLELWLPGSARG